MAKIYSYPGQEPLAHEISVKADGESVPVLYCTVSKIPFNRRWPGHQRSREQAERAYFAGFASDKPVTLTLRPEKEFEEVIIRPLSKGVKPEVSNGAITLTLPSPGGYTVELDGIHNALHLFFDPVKGYSAPEGHKILRYPPGMHDAGLVRLESKTTVIIEQGAIVFGSFHAENAEDINILGAGILDNGKNVETILFEVAEEDIENKHHEVANYVREHTIDLRRCENVRIEGITIRDSLLYNVSTHGCKNILCDNIKIIGSWRYNSDGIDFHNTVDSVVRNCFVRTFDDSICVKGHEGWGDEASRILVENCVVWCDWDHTLEIGAETCAEHMRDIVFRNCDLIHNNGACLDIYNVHYGEVSDVLFEDIRVEYEDFCLHPRYQEREDMEYDPGDGSYMSQLIHCSIHYNSEYSKGFEARRGRNRGITYKDIQVTAKRMPPSYIAGFDEEHRSEDIKIVNLTLNGERVDTLEKANVRIGEFVKNVTIE